MSMGDEQAAAEQLDEETFDRSNFPPDEPVGFPDLEGDETLVTGDFDPESFAQRRGREEPDFSRPTYDIASEVPGGLMDPDDAYAGSVTAELIGERGEFDDDAGGVHLSDSAAYGHGSEDWPAEEAALHLIDDTSEESGYGRGQFD